MSTPTTPTPQTPPTTARPLRRRRDNRIVAGVCGGIADYTGIDVALVRILAVVLVLCGLAGIPLYLAGWLLIPLQGTDRSPAEQLLAR